MFLRFCNERISFTLLILFIAFEQLIKHFCV